MNPSTRLFTRPLAALIAVALALAGPCRVGPAGAIAQPTTEPSPAGRPQYFPARGSWETRTPSAVGMDDALLAEAVAWAKAQETDMPRDFSTQAEIFGRPMGPVPKGRAATNGLILRHGYIVAEWGDTGATDPSYSIAKSYLSTILGLTTDRGMIRSVTDPVGEYIQDGGYEPPHNSRVTWEQHATQTSEWDGVMFGKPSTFIGSAEFGRGAMKPRELHEPGTYYEYNDVRINRFSLSLLRLWKRPLPEVLKTEIMDPIGASDTWIYHGYDNSTVDIEGRPIPSVSGGTRWGGGLWMSTRDHARFGLLILRRGAWEGRQIISESWIGTATSAHGKNPGYGYLWWLNTEERWKGVSRRSFAALGAGNNTIWIDPGSDLVVVWRWHRGGDALAELLRKIAGALRDGQ